MPDCFGLYLILTDPVAGYEACTKAAVERGIAFVQLRLKNEPRENVVSVGRRLREITRGTRTRLIINDFVDVAKEIDADGVHLGQDDMRLAQARRVWGRAEKIFGLSTHNREQEKRARALKPDYIGVGPVFPTPTKAVPDPTLGLKQMAEIISLSPLTCVAIGGINEDNLSQVLKYGAVNFSVVRAVNHDANPGNAIDRLMNLWTVAREKQKRPI